MSAILVTEHCRIDHTMRIPGDFEGTYWEIDARLIDPLWWKTGDHAELEIVGVRLQIWDQSKEIPVHTLPEPVYNFFAAELIGDYEAHNEADMVDAAESAYGREYDA